MNCSDYVSPVCLPESTTNAYGYIQYAQYDDKPATIAGWGTVDPVSQSNEFNYSIYLIDARYWLELINTDTLF